MTFRLTEEKEKKIIDELCSIFGTDSSAIELFNSLIPESAGLSFQHTSNAKLHYTNFIKAMRGHLLSSQIIVAKSFYKEKPGSEVLTSWLESLRDSAKPKTQDYISGPSASVEGSSIAGKVQRINVIDRIKAIHACLEVNDRHFPACSNPTETPCEAKQQACWLMAESSLSLRSLSDTLYVGFLLETIHKQIAKLIDVCGNTPQKPAINSLRSEFRNLFNFFSLPKRHYLDDNPEVPSKPIERFNNLVRQRAQGTAKTSAEMEAFMQTLDDFKSISTDLGFNEDGCLLPSTSSVIPELDLVVLSGLTVRLQSIIITFHEAVKFISDKNAEHTSESLINWFKEDDLTHVNFTIKAENFLRLFPHLYSVAS